jgi:hypothetical protein
MTIMIKIKKKQLKNNILNKILINFFILNNLNYLINLIINLI